MKIIMWWKSSCDESHHVMKVIKWWKLSSGESYQVMKVIKWWKLSCNESFLVMKLIWWWKLYSDESYLVMKVKEVEIVLKSDGWWRFACGDVYNWDAALMLLIYNSNGYNVKAGGWDDFIRLQRDSPCSSLFRGTTRKKSRQTSK